MLKAFVITGPTASGKSALAMALAQRLPMEIIVADSAQVYKGMDIGAAKPSRADQQAVPHHLLDIRDPRDPYTAQDFCQDATRLAGEIAGRRRLPVIVGGAMLYLRALREGLSPLPPADPEERAAILEAAREKGWAALHAELAQVDPEAAKRIRPSDPQRLQRALEVHRLTGKPLSELQARPRQPAALDLTEVAIMPPDRAALHRRIEARFDQMLSDGFLDEVRRLRRHLLKEAANTGAPQGAPSPQAAGASQERQGAQAAGASQEAQGTLTAGAAQDGHGAQATGAALDGQGAQAAGTAQEAQGALAAGAAQEAQGAQDAGALPALKAVGYRQAWAHLEGELSYEQMRAKALAATRGLAKRQLTWLRSWPHLRQLPKPDVDRVLKIASEASILSP